MYCAASASTIHGYETPFSSKAPSSPGSNTGVLPATTDEVGSRGSIVMTPMRDRFRESLPVTYTLTTSASARGTAKDAPV
jgi:hypothetical protein